MSVHKLGISVFSSFLMFATAPLVSAQQENPDAAGKQTITQSPQTTPTPSYSDKSSMHHSMSGKGNVVSKAKVREVQSALKKEGFDPGPIDGMMGPMTINALRNYQSQMGMQVTGTINAETEKSLMGAAS